MAEYLYVAWKDKLVPNAIKVYRVDGNIDFADGKAMFKLTNGTSAKIDVEQLQMIGVTGNIDMSRYTNKTTE